VLVLGRAYTIHNEILNSNVPSILREQGTIALPVDCYPVPPDAPVFPDIFWGQGQRILRAAWHARREPDIYTVFCSNYSCGPDSFMVHFYAWLTEGRPFAIIETDGHAGDAGTKTRIEAFLHCVTEDRRSDSHPPAKPGDRLTVASETLSEIVARHERMLIPRMGPEACAVAAALRGIGVEAETLPMPTGETLRIGRRHTSGKECLPMTVTLGSLLARIEPIREGDERFTFLMPGSDGPCRFGVYKNLFRLVLDRLGWRDRVRIWSPPFGDYFHGQPAGFKAIAFAGICAAGVLNEALHDVRPVETRRGSADSLHATWSDRLCRSIEQAAAGDLSLPKTLMEISTGCVWGIPALLRQAAAEFSAVKGRKDIPNVLVVGEIYVRSDPFSNDFISLQLEDRGIRTRIEPASEFVQYSDYIAGINGSNLAAGDCVERCLRARILGMCRNSMAKALGWRPHVAVPAQIAAAGGYLRRELEVESVLTIGVALEEWLHGDIDAVVSVGPLECLPTKIAEAQFHHICEREGLLSLTVPLNGEPIDSEILDSFSFEVHQRHRRRMADKLRKQTVSQGT
jgi:predicted nucleotide-binding protein (sugar kinase/HSP70/actin superfamily)